MDARSLILDLMTNGYTRAQIARQAKVTPAGIGRIVNGDTKMTHRQTLFGLLAAHAGAIRAAQKRLEATTHEIKYLEAEVYSLRLAESLKVLP